MTSIELTRAADTGAGDRPLDAKLEVVVLPVSDVERAKSFYQQLGWRLDADFVDGESFHLVQLTPPGSPCSVIFGKNATPAAPGSAQGLYLVVSDIEEARDALAGRGIDVSEVFHGAEGVYEGSDEAFLFGHHRQAGPDPERRSYRSYASFRDPDGNGWLLQEVTARLPGRISVSETSFASPQELARALRRAAAAHDSHEKHTGGDHSQSWPDWYAEFLVTEQHGEEYPVPQGDDDA
jgi:catechol 2,3-dioxygenase-like lactoylglutathione lyase family enzyme